jgi:acetylornithine/succinyldiaminopimelate/putrescine aminotransferase
VLRFLPPFLLDEKHVDKGINILRKQLAAAQKQHKADAKAAKLASSIHA